MSPLPPKPKDSRAWRDSYYHKLLALKAALRVTQELPAFTRERPADRRPQQALAAVRAWAEGKRKLSMREVRTLSLAAHAAAKVAKTEGAKCVAHAAGQAIGTWHAPAHALGAFEYAGRAFVLRKRGRPAPAVRRHRGGGRRG